MRKKIMLVAFYYAACFSHAQDVRLEHLSKTFDVIKDSLGFNGVLSIVNDDSIFFNGYAGFASREFQVEISSNTKFRIASLSKPIISYAIHILADQGKVEFESSISNYLPKISDELTDKILLKHLISHNSGLIRDFKVIENGTNQKHYSREEIINLINQSKLQSIPGEHYSYSNTGYTLLAFIIESVTKLPLNEALNQLIFEPLGMNSTGAEKLNKVYPYFANGYDKLGGVYYKSIYEDKSHVFGSGSIYSSANDMSRFAIEVMDGSLLSQEMHNKYLEEVDGNRSSSGWITWHYKSQLDYGSDKGQVLYFAGSCPGFSSFIAIYLEHRVAVVGLMNQVPINTSRLNNVFGNIMVGYSPEGIRKPVIQDLLPKICTEDLTEVKKYYESFLKEHPGSYIKDYELNQIGYVLLGHQEIENAIKVFNFMTMIFPDNSNAFDSLGEALIYNGDIDAGLSAYKKSLELEPNNGNAKAIIEQYN